MQTLSNPSSVDGQSLVTMTLDEYFKIEEEIVSCGGRMFRVCDTQTLAKSQVNEDLHNERVERINTWERVLWFLGGAALVIGTGFMILWGSGQLIPNQQTQQNIPNSPYFIGVGPAIPML